MTPIATCGLPPNVEKFLKLITWCEGTDRDKTPYNELFGYTNFVGYDKHPEILIKTPNYASTAAGRYQVLKKTFAHFKKSYPDAKFTPEWQDKIAIFLIKQAGGYKFILDGEWEKAIKATAGVWASLPGSPYGQPTRKMADALKFLKTA